MSASSSIPPNNLMMLGVIGIGAYWFLTRRATAAPLATQSQIPGRVANPYTGSVAQTVGSLVGKIFGSSNGTADGRSATPWSTTPSYGGGASYNNPSAYASSAVDGVAYNPPASSVYDSVDMGTATGDDLSSFY